MKVYSKSEARRILKRVFKTGSIEPRRHSLANLSTDELLDKLRTTKDQRKVSRITREIARRLVSGQS